ncbi:MAG: TPM domain-containing protein [Hyphomicrobiaceae bacterium]|nr:TPM domain-containing protein [Hyphomicrobiaceae bacterium]
MADNHKAACTDREAIRRATALFSEAEQARIAKAITTAEQATSGEIVAVIATECDSYLYAPFMWSALIALLVPWPLIFMTWMPVQHIFLIQLIAFIALLLVLLPKPIRFALIPRAVKHERAHRRAIEQFVSQDLHTTAGRTGVLIFVSVAERYAEVLADVGIDAKVPPGTWRDIVDNLTASIAAGRAADGFVNAITAAGQQLAQHFPPGSANPNELPNHLIVLD